MLNLVFSNFKLRSKHKEKIKQDVLLKHTNVSENRSMIFQFIDIKSFYQAKIV